MEAVHKIHTSFVFKLGVERDELDPLRDGGRSADAFELLPLGLSFPFSPMLSRESTAWSPFARGDGDSYEEKNEIETWIKWNSPFPEGKLYEACENDPCFSS